MGGYDIGGLFGALNLDDSQFSEALARASGASRLFLDNVSKINSDVTDVLDVMDKFGYNTDGVATSITRAIVPTKELSDSLSQFVRVLSDAQAKARDFSVQGNNIGATELDHYRALVAAEQLRVNGLKDSYKVQQDMLNLSTRLRSEEAAGIQDTVRGLEQERQIRLNALEAESRNAQDYANLTRQLRASEIAGEQQAANERVALANQIATADKRMADDRIKLANQIAEGEVRAAAIEAEAANSVVNSQAIAEKAERRRFEQHRQLQQLAGALTTVGFAAGAIGAAGLGAEVTVAKEAATFQDAMAKSLTVIGDVSSALQDQLASAAREAAKETGLAAKDIAGDFAIMKKGGLDAADSIKLVGTFSQFAVANQVPLHDSTKQLLTVMEAFGLKAADLPKIADELTRGAQLSRSSVDQLATSLEGRAGSALKSVNVSLEESIALSIAFARRGYEASAAQTALSQVINRVTALARTHSQVTADVNGKIKSFHDIVYSANGAVRPFIDTLKDLNGAFTGGSAEAVGKFFDEIKMGTTRGVDAVKAIVGVADEISNLSTDVAGSTAVMVNGFNNQMKSPLAQLEKFKRGLEDIEITLGIPMVSALGSVAQALKPILDGLSESAKWFSELPSEIQTTATLLGVVGAGGLVAGGGLIAAAGGALRLYGDIRLLAGVGGPLEFLSTAFKSVTTSAEAISGLGLGAMFIGVGSAITGVVLALRDFDKATAKMHAGSEALPQVLASEITKIQTDKELAAWQQTVNNMLNGGALEAKEYAQALALLDLKAKDLDKTSLASWSSGVFPSAAQLKAQLTGSKSSISDDPEADAKARTLAAKQAATLEEAQAALNKYADSYNANFQLLTSQQRSFLEGSFSALNDILGRGVNEGNIATFRARLADYSNSLREFTADAKSELEKGKIDESIRNFSEKILVAGAGLEPSLRSNYQGWLTGIKALVDAGLDPRLVAPKLKELEDQFNGSVSLAAKASSLFDKLPDLVRQSLGVNLKDIKSANEQFGELLTKLSAIDTLRKYGANQVADYIADKYQQKSLTSQLGIGQNTGKAQTFENLATELIGTNAPLLDKQKGLIAYFEEAAKEAGVSAEAISQTSKIMIDGVVQDYSVLKDKVKSSLSLVKQTWADILTDIQGSVTKFIGGLGGSLFDTLFPNFVNPTSTNKLQPLVDSFRSAFEQLSAYSDPKNALTQVVKDIQAAGTAAKANAIAVKYFGTTAGPQLAAELRDGTISASDLAKAIDLASASTLDYGKTTSDSTSQITQLWRQLVKDVTVAILEHLIILGINAILIALKLVDKNTKSLASSMEQIFTKLGIQLGILFGKISADITASVRDTVKAVEKIINNMYATATIVIKTIYETVGDPNGGGGSDPGNLFNFGGNLGGGYDPFGGGFFNGVDPFTGIISAAKRTVGMPHGASAQLAVQGTNFNGPITVVADSPEAFVKKLKQRRIVKGL